ncbi:DUF4226 domain-containing protein [Mycolicibacterium sarraceniae]|uniref:DUF4226 domain-containing protein n=1 Tax=Mycolicibacterium sarraceniae TaxID=1534348 RepID=A0A7I7SP50_9MYCO|nr:DUF4226 domain-containing protein [Mycolicibacterium sarraceniae]BBY58533.1 hypothetical protein MSAR_16690 [Mycolicibacterium sarraceniae]
MAEHVGASGEALEAARAVLAARENDLAAADAELADVVCGAHAAATAAIRKLDALSAQIEAAVAQRTVAAPSEGLEFARFLLAKHHEISDILTAARADADAKVVVLQQLSNQYRV